MQKLYELICLKAFWFFYKLSTARYVLIFILLNDKLELCSHISKSLYLNTYIVRARKL